MNYFSGPSCLPLHETMPLILFHQATMGVPVVMCAVAPLLRFSEGPVHNPGKGFYPVPTKTATLSLIVSKMLRVALLQVLNQR
jgi:hypothetical protein